MAVPPGRVRGARAASPSAGGGGVQRGGGGGGEAATVLRPLAQPHAVRVVTDQHGTPAVVHLDGRGSRRGTFRVEAVREVWRIDDEWWRRPVSREYVAVTLAGGRPLTLYRDLVEGGWYVQG